jgi:hypothetical protein
MSAVSVETLVANYNQAVAGKKTAAVQFFVRD